MKTLYQCEKCGKIFDGENAWEETRACERGHLDIETGFIYTKEFGENVIYSQGEKLPESLILSFDEYDENGIMTRHFATFTRGKELSGKKLEVMMESIAERERAEAERHAKWKAEREAKQAQQGE